MKPQVRIYCTLAKRQDSIISFANKIVIAFKEFANYDKRFRHLHAHLKSEDLKIDLFRNDSCQLVAEAILQKNIDDIRKFNKIPSPTVNYERPFGFSFGFHFQNIENKNIFNFHTTFGGKKEAIHYKMNEIPIKQIEIFPYDWYFNLFKALVKYLPIEYAVLRPRDVSFVENTRKQFLHPIGWITYLSNDLTFLIPNDFEGLSCESQANGVLYSIEIEQFCDSEEAFKKNINELNILMARIGKDYPDYLISSD